MPIMPMNSSYLMLVVVTLIIGLGAQWYVNHKLKVYNHVANSTGLTGSEAARQMLAYYGITNVQVFRGGPGQDYFDPRSNSVTLSPEAYLCLPSALNSQVAGANAAYNIVSHPWLAHCMT